MMNGVKKKPSVLLYDTIEKIVIITSNYLSLESLEQTGDTVSECIRVFLCVGSDDHTVFNEIFI